MSGPVVLAIPPGDPGVYRGTYNQQNLLHLDASFGRWLYQDPTRRIQGIAAVFELHYTSTLQDSDRVEIANPSTQSNVVIGNGLNRLDILNATIGANLLITPLSTLRIGFVMPLELDPERQFDNELQISFNKYF
ncbi:MAG: hypothetical protein QM811_19550 [Pirellulales bacterium]